MTENGEARDWVRVLGLYIS